MNTYLLITTRGGLDWGPCSLQGREQVWWIRVSPGPSGFLFFSVSVPGECLWKGSPKPGLAGKRGEGRGAGVGAGQAWGGSLQPQPAQGAASVFAPLECG